MNSAEENAEGFSPGQSSEHPPKTNEHECTPNERGECPECVGRVVDAAYELYSSSYGANVTRYVMGG